MELREQLRAIPVFPSSLPVFDVKDSPDDPILLFRAWLEEALAAGQPAPHVMTLATADESGRVSARNLILKDIDERGWQFATHSTSPKAQGFARNPYAALAFFWPTVGRQIRVSGPVAELSQEAAAADFLARPADSRAATLVGRQSEVLADREDVVRAIDTVHERLERDPSIVDQNWALYAVEATRVEFWQAAHDRVHTRLRYFRPAPGIGHNADRWSRELLWP